MTTNNQIGVTITLIAAIAAAAGLLAGYLSHPVAADIAVIGILVGTGVSRGKFSGATGAAKTIDSSLPVASGKKSQTRANS